MTERKTKVRPLRDFAMLDEDWYEDDVLHAIAEETTPMVFAYLPMLIGRCRELSHFEDNPLGWVKLTVKQAAKMVCDEPAGTESADAWLGCRMAMWAGLHDGEIVEIDGTIASRFRTRLINFRKFQTPKGSSTDRSRTARTLPGISSPRGQNGDAEGTPCNSLGTHSDRDRDRDKEKKSLVPKSDKPTVDTSLVDNVFEYWVKVERETGGMGSGGRGSRSPKPTKERLAKIRSRLLDGYTAADLKMAIAFFARDPHHSGDNGRSTRYTDLVTTLKNGAKVEAGIAGYEARGAGASSPDTAAFLRTLEGAA